VSILGNPTPLNMSDIGADEAVWKQLGAPLHRQSREDEISYVLEGELTVQQGDRRDTAGVGGTIVKPRGVFHTFWNAGVTPVRFLEVIAPGAFAQYFRELAPLLQGGAPQTWLR